MTIDIHELSVPLTDNEEFYLYVPEDYYSSTVSYISYNGMTGAVEGTTPLQGNLSQYSGDYVRLKYKYYHREEPANDYIKFIVCE